jgi:Zn-dependent protease
VRIHPGFWVLPIFFGLQGSNATPQQQLQSIAIWTAVVFFSVMLHEMGHALVGRAFGARPSILLHFLGGVTFLDVRMSRARGGLVSLAGPLAGILLGTSVYFAAPRLGIHHEVVDEIIWVNVWWGVLNLFPVLPFDGGHILAAVLGPRRVFATSVISAVLGAGVSALALRVNNVFIAVLFGSSAVSAVRQARVAWAASADARSGLEARLAEARALLDRGDADAALAAAVEIAEAARTLEVKNRALILSAWCHVARGEGQEARAALLKVEPRSTLDPYTYAAVEDAAGDPDGARDVLEHARRSGMNSREIAKLLIDLYAREDDLAAAVQVATEDAKILGRDDARAVLVAVAEGGLYRAAASLAARLYDLFADPEDALDEARALAHLGDRDSALHALARAVRGGSAPDSIRRDAAFSELATDERFERILGPL